MFRIQEDDRTKSKFWRASSTVTILLEFSWSIVSPPYWPWAELARIKQSDAEEPDGSQQTRHQASNHSPFPSKHADRDPHDRLIDAGMGRTKTANSCWSESVQQALVPFCAPNISDANGQIDDSFQGRATQARANQHRQGGWIFWRLVTRGD